MFTDVDACLRNVNSVDENLIPVSTKLTHTEKVVKPHRTRTLPEVVSITILHASEADGTPIH